MSLEAVKLKIGWAAHHFDLLCSEVTKYIDTYPPKFVIKRESSTHTEAWGIFCGPAVADVCPAIPLILGDVLQTVHSSLDYLICELIRTGKEEPTASNQFPIAESRAVFGEEIGRKRLRDVPFGAIAVIEGLQPYHAGKDAHKSALFALKTLTNIHKHRNLLVTALNARKAPPDIPVIVINGKTYTIPYAGLEDPFDLDAELGPFVIDGPNVKMEDTYASVVVLAETLYRGRELTSLINWVCMYVRDTVIPQFQRFF